MATKFQISRRATCKVAGEVTRVSITIVHRPGLKHNNVDALLRLPCRECGKQAEHTIASISSPTVSGGYSANEIRQMQLDDKCLGALLQAKESS